MTLSVWGSFGAVTPTRELFAAATIAELKTFNSPKSGFNVTVSVDGRVVIGDGLGGIYTWNETDTRADDGVDVIQPNTLPSTGRWNLTTSFPPGGSLYIDKTSTQGILSNNTILTDETQLQVPLLANERWSIEWRLFGAGMQTTGMKLAVVFPAGAVGNLVQMEGISHNGKTSVGKLAPYPSGTSFDFPIGLLFTNDGEFSVVANITNGSTPGNAKIQFCQSTFSGGVVAAIMIGSIVKAIRRA